MSTLCQPFAPYAREQQQWRCVSNAANLGIPTLSPTLLPFTDHIHPRQARHAFNFALDMRARGPRPPADRTTVDIRFHTRVLVSYTQQLGRLALGRPPLTRAGLTGNMQVDITCHSTPEQKRSEDRLLQGSSLVQLQIEAEITRVIMRPP